VAEAPDKNLELLKLKIAIAGNPNSGKSTLFNVLTGLNQKTGNFPGVTVDKHSGSSKLKRKNGSVIMAEFIDLPGTYSLNPKSLDEHVAYNVLCVPNNPDRPDITVVVTDASNLKRSLFLATQVIELQIPVVLVLNMMDLVEEKGMTIDTTLLSTRLGVPIVTLNAREKKGVDALKLLLTETVVPSNKAFITKKNTEDPAQENIERYRIISSLLEGCIKTIGEEKESFSHKLDKILTHRIWGYLIFLFILFIVFQSIFYIAAFPMGWIESAFTGMSEWGSEHLPHTAWAALLINGILAGLSGVIIFIPQIALLFAFISILEDTGYMARVSFIMDKLMRRFGLNGKSVIPLISGVACAVPAIMSTRTIGNWKERMITIMVTPLMSCSARLPVYTLLTSLIIPVGKTWGFFNLQGLILMAMYLIGFIAALGAAWVMKFILRTKEKSYFIMEMPVYRAPLWSNVGYTIYEKVRVFIVDAGKVIIAVSIILWALSSYGPGDSFEKIEKKYQDKEYVLHHSQLEIDNSMASEKLEASYAGHLGKAIEPAIAPLGFDWKIGIALVTSFAAREVFVGTMATIYSVGNTDNTQSIREKMSVEKNAETGEAKFTLAVGLSLMIFYAFAMQCMSTIAVVYRETNSWKWPAIQFLYMGALAWVGSFVVYNIFK